MAVPFGFSVGDFLAAIELTVRIGKALRESGGATAEYRLLHQDLLMLRQVLEILQELNPTGVSPSRINAIKGMALTCLTPLTEFAAKLDKSYASSLGAVSSARLLKRSSKKVQWALLSVDEVSKFRAIISSKVVSTSLLLGTCNSEAISTVHKATKETQAFLRDQAVKGEQNLQDNFSKLSVNSKQYHENLLARVAQLREKISSDVSSIKGEQANRDQKLGRKLDEQQEAMLLLNARLTETLSAAGSHHNRLVGVCCGIQSANRGILINAQAESRQIKSELRLIAAHQRKARSSISSIFRPLLLQVKMLQTMGENILNLLIPFSQKVLDYLQQNTMKNIEIFTILLRLEAALPKAIADGEADNIFFEDVLGRTKHLPYIYFRHWEVFESMLRCEFRGLPGEQKVLDGHYRLVIGKPDGLQIDEKAWEQTVFPDTRVKMSVEIAQWGANWTTVFCPRCRHLFTRHRPEETILYQCTTCNIEFLTQRTSRRRSILGLLGLKRDGTFDSARSKALRSHATKWSKGQYLDITDTITTLKSSVIADTVTYLEGRDIHVFRLVHLKNASLTVSDIFTPGSSFYDETAFTTEYKEDNLENYYRAVMLDSFSIANSTTDSLAANGTLRRKTRPLGDIIGSGVLVFEVVYDVICAMMSDHIHGLVKDIKRLMRSTDNGTNFRVLQTMKDNVWPGFRKRAGIVENHLKKLGDYCSMIGVAKPSILQHTDLEMLSLAEGFGFEALQRLVEESVFRSDGKIIGLQTEQEIKFVYESTYKPKFYLV